MPANHSLGPQKYTHKKLTKQYLHEAEVELPADYSVLCRGWAHIYILDSLHSK